MSIEKRNNFRDFPDVNDFPRGMKNPSLARSVYVAATDSADTIKRPCDMDSDCPQESDEPDCCETFTCE